MNPTMTPSSTPNGRAAITTGAIRAEGLSLREWVSPARHNSHHDVEDSVHNADENHLRRNCVIDSTSPGPDLGSSTQALGQEKANGSPLPAPLHVIQSFVKQDPIIRLNPRLSTHTWSGSQMSAPVEDQLEQDSDHGRATDCVVGSDDGVLGSVELHQDLERYLGGWLFNAADQSESNPIEAWRRKSDHAQCDVDTITGQLLPPVKQPLTVPRDRASEDGRDITFKQRGLTSQKHMDIAMRFLNSKGPEAALPPGLAPDVAQEQGADVEEPEWPKADCVLRPALETDLAAITELANVEAQSLDCPQIIQSQPITPSEMKRILDSCRNHYRPFVVAEAKPDVLLDRAQWPAGAEKAYQEYMKYRKAQSDKKAEMLGFAFVTEPRIGFLNTPCPGSRHSGQVRLVVHPNHRRHGYGSALLDRVLQSIMPTHRSLIDFDWHGSSDDSPVYARPSIYNRRQYARLYVELFTKADKRVAPWRETMLEKFQFKKAALFTKMVKTDRGAESEWLDVAIWELNTQHASKILNKEPGTWLR